MSQTCVSIDLEMTSARAESQEVIEIAAIKFRDERVLDTWSTLVRPSGSVPYNIQVLTGIDPANLRRAPTLAQVTERLQAFVGDHPLVAHSVGLDVACLRRQGVVLENPQYDTFELASILLPQMSSYSLASIAAHFGIDFPQQHRAVHDALVTKQVFLRLLDQAGALELGLIQEINRLTANHAWPLKALFQEIEVALSRHALGSSIRQALAAKGGADDTDLELLLVSDRNEEPLRPAKAIKPVAIEALSGLYAPDGLLAQKLPGFERREPQVRMMSAVAEALNDGEQLVVEAGTGTGKALDIETPIPTPDGWKRMGDLQAGDVVFDENGDPCNVVTAWPIRYDRRCYEVVFSDGSVIVADGEHLWTSWTQKDRRQGDRARGPGLVVSTDQIRRTLKAADGGFNHAIPVATRAVQYRETDLPIDPFIVGQWLGDGSSRKSRAAVAPPAVRERLVAVGPRTTQHLAGPDGRCNERNGPGRDRWPSELAENLARLCPPQNPHMPSDYLVAGGHQRRSLLAGLLERGGTELPSGVIEFTSPSERLAQEVHELGCSLGYLPILTRARARFSGEGGEPEWKVAFTIADAGLGQTPRARFKRPGCAPVVSEDRYREVIEIRPAETRPVRCIAVDSPNHLYLAGKSFIPTHNSVAYLVPSIYFASQNDERVVVSTNTINLQDQLIQKDLPDLQRVLPVPFKATVLKGRSNYLCLQRLAALRRRADLTLAEALALIKILVWLPTTETGDVSELNLADAERAVWAKLYAHPEICTPSTCRYARRGRCFLYRARARAEAAHIIVVNHALLLSDVVSASKVLPEYRHLVVDEAHHLEQQATDQLGYILQSRDVLGFLDDLAPTTTAERRAGLLGELPFHFRGSTALPSLQQRTEEIAKAAVLKAGEVRAAVEGFFSAVVTFMASRPSDGRGYDQRARLTSSARRQPAWNTVELAWETLELRLIALQESLSQLQSALTDLESANLLDYEDLMSQLNGAIGFNDRLRSEGNALVSNPQQDRIYWVTLGGNGETSLHAAPLDVAPLLQAELYGDKRAVVLTSATLTAAGSFDYMKGRLGLADAVDLAVGSPFDYRRSTLVVVPSDMPEPEQPQYQRAVHQSLLRLCAATEGRALVLFTSHAQLRAAWQAIHGPLAQQGILVLGHGVDGSPRRQLLNTFKTNPKTVLLGASSFWEGIDVVGEALSVLVITRLPFAVPSDPVVAARSELFDDPFGEYSLPQAILKFRQGFGRLIRSASDRGVVVVLDRRVQTKFYGPRILKSLPPCPIKSLASADLPKAAKWWLERKNGSAEEG